MIEIIELSIPARKEKLVDFFNIDIYDIFKYHPILVTKDANRSVPPVDIYALNCREQVLSTFTDVDIICFGEDDYNLIFKSKSDRPSKEMIRFIDACAEEFGLDINGNGKVTKEDLELMKYGLFSRFWRDISIHNLDFQMTMMIFDTVTGQWKR